MGHAQTEGLLRTGLGLSHYEQHMQFGSGYVATIADESMGDGDEIALCFKTPEAKDVHMTFAYTTKAAAHVELLEGALWSGGQTGEQHLITCRNRITNPTSGMPDNWQVNANWSLSGMMHKGVSGLSGAVIWDDYVFTAFAVGMKNEGSLGWVLNTGTQYAFRLEADAGTNAGLIELNWHEE